MVHSTTLMGGSTRGDGREGPSLVKVASPGLMGIVMWGSGKMGRDKDGVLTTGIMGTLTRYGEHKHPACQSE